MKKGIHHISLKARGAEEFARVLDFYQTVLDCPAVRRWGEGDGQGAMLDLGKGSGPMDHGFDIQSRFSR